MKEGVGFDVLIEIERKSMLPVVRTVRDIVQLRAAASISQEYAEKLLLKLDVMAHKPGYVQTMLQHDIGKNKPGRVT